MNHFPLFADLKDRTVVVVGAGLVAERKIALLRAAGARVIVSARACHPQVLARAQAGEIELRLGEFDPALLDEAWLAVAATSDRAQNRRVADAAAARRLFCNVVDDPELSSVQVPAIVDRAPLTIAISSGGAAPVIASLRMPKTAKRPCLVPRAQFSRVVVRFPTSPGTEAKHAALAPRVQLGMPVPAQLS